MLSVGGTATGINWIIFLLLFITHLRNSVMHYKHKPVPVPLVELTEAGSRARASTLFDRPTHSRSGGGVSKAKGQEEFCC